MNKLKKILSLALASVLMGGALVNVGSLVVADEAPTTLTYEFNYKKIPDGFVKDSGTSGTFTVNEKTSTTLPTLTVAYAGINTKSSATSDDHAYGYAMFCKNTGFLYANAAISGYYPSKVTVKTGSNTGTVGKIGTSFGSSVISSRNSSVSGSVAKSASTNYTNSIQTNTFWNFSTTGANVQMDSFTITYTKAIASTPCDVPTATITNNKVTINVDTNSTNGYGVTLFTYDTDYVQFGNEISIAQPNSGTSVEKVFDEIPQGINFYVKVRALGNGGTYEPSSLSGIISVSGNPVALVNNTYLELNASEVSSKPTQTAAPYVYYDVRGIVDSINSYTNDSVTSYAIKLLDIVDSSKYVYVNNVLNFASYVDDVQKGDTLVIRGHRKTDAKFYDGTVINHSFDPIKRVNFEFSALKTYSSLSVSYSSTEIVSQGITWKLVTSNDQLVAGAKYTVASGTNGAKVAMSNSDNKNNRKTTEVNIDSKKFADSTDVMCLVLSGNSTSWEFQASNYGDGDLYLNASSDTGNNYLWVDVQDDYSKFTINIDATSYAATIKCAGKTSRNIMKYNSSSNCFSCYSSGQSAIYLFKAVEGESQTNYSIKTENVGGTDKNLVSMRFGVAIPTTLKNSIDAIEGTKTYGISLKKGELDATLIPFSSGALTKTPMATDSEADAENQNYYQYALSLDHIPTTDFDKEVTVCGYVTIGETTLYTTAVTYSVQSMAADYVTNHANETSVKNFVGMLNWLKTYGGEAA